MGVDVADLEAVGEFGSKAWCEACGRYGVQLLEEGDLPADTAWGFSEIYTHPPARLLEGGRQMSAYYLMVKDGRVSGGDGAPEECRALPGFHVAINWAAICNQSRSLYGREGQRQRSAEEKVMYQEIEDYVGRPNPLNMAPRAKAVWPPAVGATLGAGSEEGGGLHNIAATLQAPSPEFADLPTTELGVPVFSAMTDEQKRFFLALCGAEL
ncbi:MAG: hypothetical protein OXH09_01270 [Gammaproteobacteria bacterium]|nr:hypothetical protein [Gammaproteobacteria bacterium]